MKIQEIFRPGISLRLKLIFRLKLIKIDRDNTRTIKGSIIVNNIRILKCLFPAFECKILQFTVFTYKT